MNKKIKIERIKEWKSISGIMLPFTFFFTCIAYIVDALTGSPSLGTPAPFFAAYAFGFLLGYKLVDRLTGFNKWLESEEITHPPFYRWFAAAVVISYLIATSVAYSYALRMEISFEWDDLFIGWGLLVWVAAFSGFYGGSSLTIYRLATDALERLV